MIKKKNGEPTKVFYPVTYIQLMEDL